MLQFSVRALILRAREFYSRVKPMVTRAGQLASAVTASKELLRNLRDSDSQFSVRYPHRDSDKLTICFFITLLWMDIQRRADRADSFDRGNLDALMDDCLAGAIRTIAKSMVSLPADMSVNETYDTLIKAGTRAYIDNKAPHWDDTLMAMFNKNMAHPVAEAYISAYGSTVIANDRWLTVMKTQFPDISSEEMRLHITFLLKLAEDNDLLKVSIEMARSTRTNWYSYLPTAMFIASQQLFKSYLYFSPYAKAGLIAANGLPSVLMSTSSYASSRNLSRAKTVTPRVYLPKPHMEQLKAEERAAVLARNKEEAGEI